MVSIDPNDAGDYYMCGVNGCILEEKHVGLCVFPMPEVRRRRSGLQEVCVPVCGSPLAVRSENLTPTSADQKAERFAASKVAAAAAPKAPDPLPLKKRKKDADAETAARRTPRETKVVMRLGTNDGWGSSVAREWTSSPRAVGEADRNPEEADKKPEEVVDKVPEKAGKVVPETADKVVDKKPEEAEPDSSPHSARRTPRESKVVMRLGANDGWGSSVAREWTSSPRAADSSPRPSTSRPMVVKLRLAGSDSPPLVVRAAAAAPKAAAKAAKAMLPRAPPPAIHKKAPASAALKAAVAAAEIVSSDRPAKHGAQRRSPLQDEPDSMTSEQLVVKLAAKQHAARHAAQQRAAQQASSALPQAHEQQHAHWMSDSSDSHYSTDQQQADAALEALAQRMAAKKAAAATSREDAAREAARRCQLHSFGQPPPPHARDAARKEARKAAKARAKAAAMQADRTAAAEIVNRATAETAVLYSSLDAASVLLGLGGPSAPEAAPPAPAAYVPPLSAAIYSSAAAEAEVPSTPPHPNAAAMRSAVAAPNGKMAPASRPTPPMSRERVAALLAPFSGTSVLGRRDRRVALWG